jgi:hypothetical protein
LIHLNGTASHGSARPGYGLKVDLTAKFNSQQDAGLRGTGKTIIRGKLDIHGGVFAALPNGLGSVAEMMLPLDARFDAYDAAQSGEPDTWKASITLGAMKLSRGRLESTLADIVAAGDPPFVIELRKRENNGDTVLLGFLPTRASLIQQSLSNQNLLIRDDGPLKDFRVSRLRVFSGWLRWWLCPLVFLAASCFLFLYPELVLPRLPSFVLGSSDSADGEFPIISSVLPPHPKTMSQAFKLGELHQRLLLALNEESSGRGEGTTTSLSSSVASSEGEPPSAEVAASVQAISLILREASAVLGLGKGNNGGGGGGGGGGSAGAGAAEGAGDSLISAAQLTGVLGEILNIEARVGPVARVLGFFTFVNTMWTFAVVGIVVSIGPSVYHLLRPVHEFLRNLLEHLYLDVVLPTIKRLHTWGVLECSVWLALWMVLARGVALAALPPYRADAGEMVSFTGSSLAAPALAYTTFLRGRRTHKDRLATACQLFFAACAVPGALYFGSSLYGFVTVACVFGALGFGVWAGSLCIAIGFTSEHAMQRVCAAALVLVLGFCAIVAATASSYSGERSWLHRVLAPFASAVSIFGTFNLFLSLLIISSQNYDSRRSRDSGNNNTPFTPRWYWANGLMAFLLVGLNAVGRILGLPGMSNTATTFTVLFALEKYGEFHLYSKWNGWLLMLGMSLVTWKASLFLHMHPEYVSSVLGGGMVPGEVIL